MDTNFDSGPPRKKSLNDLVVLRYSTHLGDVEVEIDVIRVPNLTPQEPDWVGGDGTVPDSEPLLPPRIVSHSAKDQRPVLAQSSLYIRKSHFVIL